MQWLARVCIERPVFATVLSLVFVVVGIAGYETLSVDAFPKVDFPTVAVTTLYEGASPEEVETQISDKIEAAINTIGGIDELRSVSSEGVSQIYVTFSLEKSIDEAVQDVRDHVGAALEDLPRDVRTPLIQKLDPDATPILYLALSGNVPIRDLTELADKTIRRSLENVSGVGQVTLLGGRKRRLNVWLDMERLSALRISPVAVQQAIEAQNIVAPAGSLRTGPRDISLRLLGRVKSAAELGDLVVAMREHHAIRLKDVARVEDGAEDKQTSAYLNEDPTLVLSVRKQSGANTIEVVNKVVERVAELTPHLPAHTALQVVRDASKTIQTQVSAILDHLILGSLFSALVVLLFLGNVRATLIAALAIPISIVTTFALMSAMGFSLNIITLLALALAVGIVVDDAIVVLENCVRFLHDKNMPPKEAARLATQDIGLAVLATTLSLLAVFIPVAFMPGIVGRFLNSFGLTMAFAIFVSLLVSFSLTPMLTSQFLTQGHGKPSRLQLWVDWMYRPIEHAYAASLRFCLRYRFVVVLLCVGSLIMIPQLFSMVPKAFLPQNDEANFEINVRAPEGTSMEASEIIGRKIARTVRSLPEVAYTLLTIGDNSQKTRNLVRIYVKLVDPKDRIRSQFDVISVARQLVKQTAEPTWRIDISEVAAFNSGQSSKTLLYIVAGPDLEKLGEITDKVMAEFAKVPGAVDVDSTNVLGKPESQLTLLRDKAADLGVLARDVATTVRITMAGLKVSTFEQGGEDYEIYLQAEQAQRQHVAGMSLIPAPQAAGGLIWLRDVVSFNSHTGPSEINRVGRRRQVTISSNVAPGFSEAALQATLHRLVQQQLPSAAFSGAPTGRAKELGRAQMAFLAAFALSLVFMYLILAAQFESFVHPFTILLCLPLTLPFALIGLILLGQSFNIFSALGLLVLFGMVKKNSILQIDHTNALRAQNIPTLEAIVRGSVDRLRPILMTTIAFVAGMLPLMYARGIGAGLNQATAGIVVGGQTLSLLLTLLATPVFYSLIDDLGIWWGRLWAGRRH